MLCKPCRLQQCFEGGMVTDSKILFFFFGNAQKYFMVSEFQYNRDLINPVYLKSSIPSSLERLLGKPHFVLISDKNPKKTTIDVHRLLGEATKILNLGHAIPTYCGNNRLKKLSLAVHNNVTFEKLDVIKRATKSEILTNWEYYFKRVATCLNHFDEFKKLEIPMQVRFFNFRISPANSSWNSSKPSGMYGAGSKKSRQVRDIKKQSKILNYRKLCFKAVGLWMWRTSI